MSRKIEITDDDGNIIAPPGPDTDVGQLIYLLEYGRLRGFLIGPVVTIGAVTLQVRDVRQERDIARDSATPEMPMNADFAAVLAADQGDE